MNLLSDREVLEEVTADRSLLDAAFSESMRRDGPVVYEDRETTEPVQWYGREIPAGATVRVCIGAANTDDSVFADPTRFDLHRRDLRQGKELRAGGRSSGIAGHLGFGLGKHFCLGYQLARAEAVIGSRCLLDALPGPRLVPGCQPRLRVHHLMRTADQLKVAFLAGK